MAGSRITRRRRTRAPGSRSIARAIKEAYDALPYPGPDFRRRNTWMLAPMEWMQALWRPERETEAPHRILIAGCGTGAEALAMRRRFPAADIVGIDFSARSIAVARELERRQPRRQRPIRFVVADFTSTRLPHLVGRDFDFVSCHGVMTYVPAPARALENLSRCLTDDGALHLGVNGSRHGSVALRQALPEFGFDMGRFDDGDRLREVLRLFDTLPSNPDKLANQTAAYLASDVFGRFFQNLPLAAWIRVARDAGLHFRGNFTSHRELRPAIERGMVGLLAPRSRADVDRLLDILAPAAFHRMLLTRQPASDPPWAGRDLGRWRPMLTKLYRADLPRSSSSRRPIATFRSRAMNARVTYDVPAWLAHLLRQSSGASSIEETRGVRAGVSRGVMVQHLYVLHQLLVVNLLPPLAERAKAVDVRRP